MLWRDYVMNDHCPEYENLTMEEKLLVNIEMRKWFASANVQDLCVPILTFKIVEHRIIEILKEKDERRKARNTNADTGVVSKKRDVRTRQRKAR